MRLKSKLCLCLQRQLRNKTFRLKIIALAGVLAPFTLFSSAKAEVFVSRYDVRLAGIHMGDAVIHTTLSARRYKVAVSADVGVLFINERIQGEASGSRLGMKLTPERFAMVMSGGEDRAVEIRFKGSTAIHTKITPPLPEEAPSSGTQLKKAELRGVLDPLSALLTASLKPSLPSSNPCTTLLPIFTGSARFNIRLHTRAGSEAQKGAASVTCQAHFIPIAESARLTSAGTSLQDFRPEVYFVKLPQPNLWLLEHLLLPTPIGTVTVDRAETAISGS